MNAVLLAAALALFQGEDAVELRALSWLRPIVVRSFNSRASATRRPDRAGTFPVVDFASPPARLARIWIQGGDTRSRFRIFLDDDVLPVLNERLGTTFDESRRPLMQPTTFAPAKAAGARVTYPALLFHRMVRITASSVLGAFEVDLVDDDPTAPLVGPPGTTTKTFELPLLALQPGESGTLGDAVDAATMTQLTLVPDTMVDDDLRDVRLRIFTDGEAEASIDAPLDLLFSAPTRATTIATPGLRVSDKEMKLELPVPFARGVRVEIANGSKRAVRLRGSATLCREPLAEGTGRLRVRVREGEARAGSPFLLGECTGRGRFVGFTLRLGTKDAAALAGHVSIVADGVEVYRSISIPSAFDGAEDFGKAPYTTFGAGVSHVAENSISAFCLRVTRPISCRASLRALVEVPVDAPVAMASASFLYVDPASAASTASAPSAASAASAPAK